MVIVPGSRFKQGVGEGLAIPSKIGSGLFRARLSESSRDYDLSCASCLRTSSAALYFGSSLSTRSKCWRASIGCSVLA